MNHVTLQPGQESGLFGPGIFRIDFDPMGAGQIGYYEIHYYGNNNQPNGQYLKGKIQGKLGSEYTLNHKLKFKVKNIGQKTAISFE
ncbi:hypothetical protein [Sphingobacterium multivorum]|uniref:hypothetical protein n=1 Tax=Sphingobacterium multivorum TaxID=28454 RepID=UPI0028B20CFB|nr:hypothetical protein [Sphingobacterium multivorum]